jgi:hypothetical protein
LARVEPVGGESKEPPEGHDEGRGNLLGLIHLAIATVKQPISEDATFTLQVELLAQVQGRLKSWDISAIPQLKTKDIERDLEPAFPWCQKVKERKLKKWGRKKDDEKGEKQRRKE